jgi:hypothetical protein
MSDYSAGRGNNSSGSFSNKLGKTIVPKKEAIAPTATTPYKSAHSTNCNSFDNGLGLLSDINPLIKRTHSVVIFRRKEQGRTSIGIN